MANAYQQTLIPSTIGQDHSVPTVTDLSTKQYRFVTSDADNLLIAAGAGVATIGILQDAPNGSVKQTFGSVRSFGYSKLVLGGTVAAGAKLKSDTNGAGVDATADHDKAGAVAMSGGVSGDIIMVVVERNSISA